MTSHDPTRTHLIEAATEVFSEKGYSKASTREICRRAKANVAAVHYHFGDKAELYREVFRKPLIEMAARSGNFMTNYPDTLSALKALYRSMLEPLTSSQKSCRLMQLHAREQFEPSGVLGDIRPQAFRPQHEQLVALICRKIGLKRPDLEVQRLAFAVVGMTLVYWHGCEMVDTFAPALIRGKNWIHPLSDRLAFFAQAMIDAERKHRSTIKTSRNLSHA
jgi:AcrR family transcriptional regulator